MNGDLDQQLTMLSGVGPRMADSLQQLGLVTLQDLLFHLPIRYQDRTRVSMIRSLREGDDVLIEGNIQSVSISRGKQANLLCQLNDGTGSIYLRFFHFTAQQKNQLSIPGTRLRCFGEVRRGYQHLGFEMIHPEYRHIQSSEQLALEKKLTAVYSTKQGVSQNLLRKLVDQALQRIHHSPQLVELIPQELLEQYQLSDLAAALDYVHRPPVEAEVDLLINGNHPCQKRLSFEELIAHLLSLQSFRKKAHQQKAVVLAMNNDLRDSFIHQLPFQLTGAQQKVITEIDEDLSLSRPMLRLLQGDVGSGKTVVAALAALRVIANGGQAALMAPTELLAEQHYQNFLKWFGPLGISIGFLTGKQSAAVRRENLLKIAEGKASIVVGTHALFQEDVCFNHLVLVIVDEQHRFGVNQRIALKAKAKADYAPHQLIMSATPIPRTLAMAAYADLDISIIDELPPGRKPIVTSLISSQRRSQVIERVRLVCQSGKQVYWVCTLIEESEALQCEAAEDTAKLLQKQLADLKISLVHSRLPAEQKLRQMHAFKNGEIDLLVATTVIEVGVDVPNASVMIIENPERLGLSQLHQLRGRVGRGSAESFCLLLYQEPLSWQTQQRLQILRDTQDGFVIAREDLAIRGPGEVLGTRQSGLLRLKMADLIRDQDLLPRAHAAGQFLLEQYPQQAEKIMIRWMKEAFVNKGFLV